MRVALVGPPPRATGGLATRVLTTTQALTRAGNEVDVFYDGDAVPMPPDTGAGKLRLFSHSMGWQYDRWYSRTDATKLLTGTAARLAVQRGLTAALLRRHIENPYDVVYRMSQIELSSLRAALPRLPPLVLHPGTHAAGEARWHWAERALARAAEPVPRYLAMQAYLRGRALVQRRDIQAAVRVIAPGQSFARDLCSDYGLAPDRIAVIANPIDPDRFPYLPPRPIAGRRLNVLFVSRMSTRKGVEQVIRLSHRLGDLRDRVEITCVGGAALFSDYRPLLRHLNPDMASYVGEVPSRELLPYFERADIVVQPSPFEPFANTVGEALSSGRPVVITPAVGAGDGIDERVSRVFRTGDTDDFERAVRELVRDLGDGRGPELAEIARTEAARRFAPTHVASEIVRVLGAAAAAR